MPRPALAAPFYRTLQPRSQYQAMVIINALFGCLVETGYLAGVLSISRQHARRSRPRIARYLDRELWTDVRLYIDSLPKETPRERERYLGCRVVRLRCSISVACVFRRSAAIRWAAFSAGATPTVMSAGGSRRSARATRNGWHPPPRK
ncbi:hypothetical protein PTKU46_82770 [Paraburkholderia terrae]|uniref:hypothetical protein n=1 Tax=Paraburkholderia terrae TaxID=311230 RepID=UPI0030E548F6